MCDGCSSEDAEVQLYDVVCTDGSSYPNTAYCEGCAEIAALDAVTANPVSHDIVSVASVWFRADPRDDMKAPGYDLWRR